MRVRITLASLCLMISSIHAMSQDPWADVVINWEPGIGGAPGYDSPQRSLGQPARMSGQGIDPGVVSPFQPAWTPNELVSIGAGGELVIAFDEWIMNDPDNPHGIDLIVFGNSGFIDGNSPLGTNNGLFGADGGLISLSEDGEDWLMVPGCLADDAWPTRGWIDADPYDMEPGSEPSDFLTPMDPAISWTSTIGIPWSDLVETYGRSAGGVGIDLEPLGLNRIRFVRISVPVDAFLAPEIDGIVDVPPQQLADLDGNGLVNVNDLLMLLEAWGSASSGNPADIDNDGNIDVVDLLLMLKGWTQ
ncbi:MAG: hypothetical protein P8J89_10135 [Phycisphaerales bacterium]|nr:hypothetical protein [Phycisphaerales bacterium]